MLKGRGNPRDRIKRAIYRVRANKDLMGIGVMADKISEFKEIGHEGGAGKMATDGQTVYFNPEYVDSLSEGELRYVLVHDMMHIAYGHHIRMRGKDIKIANDAADYVVNGILGLSRSHSEGFIKKPEEMLFSDKYQDPKWTFESVYRDLLQEQQQKKPDPDGDEGEGEGEGEPDPNGRPDELSDNNQPGEVWPVPPQRYHVERMAINYKLAEARILEQAVKDRGDEVGNIIERVTEEMGNPVAWDILRNMLQTIYSDERTWARPNVIYMDHGYLPARKRSMGELHICLDTSGSVSSDDLQLFLANTKAICEEIGVPKIKVSYVDATLHLNDDGDAFTEYDVHGGEEIVFECRGRGGTRFGPIFDWIEDDGEEVSALVYFTDAEGAADCGEPEFPVIWAVTGTRMPNFPNSHPWGDHINIGKV